VEDAVAATRAAMEEGIVPGGGVALLNAKITVLGKEDVSKDAGHDVKAAANAILQRALEAPIRAIVENSGESADRVIDELAKRGSSEHWKGFNALTNKMIGDLREAGIIDPLKVTRAAFTNAISVAANYLTIGAAVTNIPEKKDAGMPGGMGGGMPGMGGDY
jgi:chaperonin GroEL